MAGGLVIVLLGLLAVCALPLLKRLGYKPSEAGTLAKMVVLIVSYSMCSSMLLIINKVAVTYIPAASSIVLCQMASTAAFCKVLGMMGKAEVEPIVLEKAKKFAVLVIAFVAILFTNVMALKHNPVDTLICFRASTPIVIAVIEFAFMGRELPSLRSWGALIGVFVGVIIYVGADYNFGLVPYLWLGSWYAIAIFEMCLVKHICDTVEMSTWSRTYYQNALSVPPIILLALCFGDIKVLTGELPSVGLMATAMSCVAGLGMSYFSFALRAVISATSFAVIGNVCKVLTILVNLLIWDKHSDVVGTVALFFCLFMGTFYRQAPMKAAGKDKLPVTTPSTQDMESSPLLEDKQSK